MKLKSIRYFIFISESYWIPICNLSSQFYYIDQFSNWQFVFLRLERDVYDHLDENIISYYSLTRRENFHETKRSVLAFPQMLPFSTT